MLKERQFEDDHIGADQIDSYIRLAITPPEEDLLQLHFEACSERSGRRSPLSRIQRRWVVTNLESNPIWQKSWRIREDLVGRSVSWSERRSFQYAGMKAHTFRPRRLAAALCVSAFLYGILWIGGRASLSETYEWASLEAYETHLDQEARGSGTESQTAFARAAGILLSVPNSTLGLFPHYDRVQVDMARQFLEVAYTATSDPFQRAEVAFFLAKISLMKNDVPSAVEWLKRVQEQNVVDYRIDSSRLIEAVTTSM